MANTKLQATAQLFLDTKDAQKDAQKFVNDLKQKLSDIESAADKMTVFKDMVDYIAQVDRAMADLKKHNKDVFGHMFDGIDTNLKAQLEGLFGVDGDKLVQIDVLREKLKTLTPKSSIKELRNFAEEINKIFTSLGVSTPFNNIAEQFSGKASAGHIELLTNALANLATVWQDVNLKIAKGFGLGGAGGSLISPKIQGEIDDLEQKIKHYESVMNKFNNVAAMKKRADDFEPVDLDFEVSEKAVDGLINKYNELQGVLNTVNQDSIEYADALAERAKVAMQLIELDNQLVKEGPEKKKLQQFIWDEGVEDYPLEDFAYEFEDRMKNINKLISDTRNEIYALKQSAVMDKTDSDFGFSEQLNSIDGAADQAGEKVDMLGKKLVNVSEYVSALSGQLKEMFAAAGRSANFEYHIAIDGLDIKARHGSEKSVDLATQTETYLDTLFSDSVLYGHSHRGGTSATNIYDIETVLSSYRDGVSIPIHFVVGKDAITTIDFTGISKDVADQLMQEIAATNNNKNAPVRNEIINKIAERFTGKSEALKTWNADQFDDLARYIYDVSSAVSSALSPMEKFQAVLDNMFGKGKVDASKHESLLSGLNQDNVKSIFNQIASIEKLQPIKATNMLTMGQVNAEIDESIAKYKTLREEANLSYSDIRSEVDKVIEHYNSGGSATSGLDFFQQYFPEGEWQKVRGLLTDAYDNLISLEEVTNRIASEFGVDPDTFAQIPNAVQDSQIEQAKSKLESFLSLSKEIQGKDFYDVGNALDNVEIGKYVERLETAKAELDALGDQGVLTAEQLEAVNTAFSDAKYNLDAATRYYSGYGNGWGDASSYDLQAAEEAAEAAQKRAEEAEYEALSYQKSASSLAEDNVELHLENDKLREQLAQKEESDDELEILRQENGALEEKLELLQNIAEQYANTVTSKNREKYEELNQKEMDSGLTPKQEERFWELGEAIDLADQQLEEFGETYDKIILKLSNGKKIEILPDDAGLRKFDKIANEYYGGEYNGYEIEDVVFVRKQEGEIIEKNNKSLREQINLEKQKDASKILETAYALKKQALSYDTLTAAIETCIAANKMLLSEKTETELSSDMMEAIGVIRSKFHFGTGDDWYKLANEKISAQDFILKIKPEFDAELLRLGKIDLENQVDKYIEGMNLDSFDDAFKPIYDGINDGTLITLDQCISKFKELTTVADQIETNMEPTDATQLDNISLEVQQLETLQSKLLEVKAAVDAKTQAFEEEHVTVDGVVDAEITSLQSLIAQLQEVVAQINLINDGFNSIDINAPKIELKSAPVEQSNVSTENPYYLTDSRGNRKLMYRGISGAISGLVSNRYHGGTFFTDLESLAKRYAGIDGKVETANISMKNPLEIDAHEHQWNDLLYIGHGADEASKKIHQLRIDIKDLEMQLIGLFDEYGAIDDIDLHDKLSYDLVTKRNELKSIYDDPSNPYGKYDTNGLVEYAKSAGYDGVVFRNIKDGTNEISNIVVTLQENQIHFVETLKTDFQSLLTDFMGYFGKIEDFLSHYNQFKTDNSLFPEIEDDGRAILGEQLDKYEELLMLGEPEIINEFLNKNKILGAYDKRVPGGLDSLLSMEDTEARIDAIVSFYLNAIYELEKIQEAFNTKATSVEQYEREQSGNLTSYDKISTVTPGYHDKALNDRESYKYADATIEDLNAKKEQAIAAANAFKELFTNLDMGAASPGQLKQVVDSFVNTIKLIDDAQSMATGIIEHRTGHPDTDAMRGFHDLGPIRDSLTSDYLDILRAESEQIEQIEIDALNTQEQRLKSEQESANIINQKTQVEAVSDATVQEEIGQLNQLQAMLVEVKNAIAAKTKAFYDEGTVVGQVVGKEIAALKQLSEIVDSIVPKVNSLVKGLKGLSEYGVNVKDQNTDNTSVDNSKPTTDSNNAPSEDSFTKALYNQKNAFNEYRKSLENVDYLSAELRAELDRLGVSIQQVDDKSGLDAFRKDLEAVKKEITIVKNRFEATSFSSINSAKSGILNAFNSLTPEQQTAMEADKDLAIEQLERYRLEVQNGKKVELSAIHETTVALRQKLEDYKEINKEAKKAATADSRDNAKFGDTALINARAKYKSLSALATSDQFKDSKTIQIQLDEYEKKYNKLLDTINRIRDIKGDVPGPDADEFKAVKDECNEYAKALDRLMKDSLKLHNTKANSNDFMLGADFNYDDRERRKAALADFAKETYGVSLSVENFKKDFKEAVFEVKNSDGTFTQMTAQFTDARNEIVAMAGDTKKSVSFMGKLWDQYKSKVQSVFSYFLATVSIYDVWRMVKQGVQYVREIDLALTELRKVTNQTEAEYRKFLQTMSKTASVTGSTVKDLTSSAADWARLGYSMQEAGELAATTAKLLNVSEFSSVDEATSALVSSLQAFTTEGQDVGQRAEEIVDILNHIGNRYPVATNELAEGLAASGAALVAANNSIEEQVALLSAGNATMQDVSTVAAGLKIVAARLRGTTTDIDDDADSAVTNVSKLQEKIKALTAEANGGEGIDIINEQGEYKSTYEILAELSKIFDKMDDVSSAALLELIAGG